MKNSFGLMFAEGSCLLFQYFFVRYDFNTVLCILLYNFCVITFGHDDYSRKRMHFHCFYLSFRIFLLITIRVLFTPTNEIKFLVHYICITFIYRV